MTRLKLAIFSTLTAIGLHSYLAWNYYPLKFARSAGESLCNINATFNCDAVAASSFSSLLGIPMALWGAITNIVFLIILLIYALKLTDNKEKTLRNAIYLATFIAVTSIVMGGISALYIKTLCLFCIGAYLCSFIIIAALWGQTTVTTKLFKEDFLTIFSANKNFLILLAVIPLMSVILHKSMLRQYGGEQLERVINSSIYEWGENPQQTFSAQPSVAMGPEKDKAKLVISEFADFLCGHCKHAAPSLHAFSQSHPDVRFEFFSFALDGECNDVVTRTVGAPCVLAKAVYCGNKAKVGWQVHDTAFHHQDKFFEARTAPAALKTLKELLKDTIKDWNSFATCIESDEALEAIKSQGKSGEQSGVKGTPTVFANGKKLPRGQLIPVLEALYKKLE